jgi:hypothetical protein
MNAYDVVGPNRFGSSNDRKGANRNPVGRGLALTAEHGHRITALNVGQHFIQVCHRSSYQKCRTDLETTGTIRSEILLSSLSAGFGSRSLGDARNFPVARRRGSAQRYPTPCQHGRWGSFLVADLGIGSGTRTSPGGKK